MANELKAENERLIKSVGELKAVNEKLDDEVVEVKESYARLEARNEELGRAQTMGEDELKAKISQLQEEKDGAVS